MWLPCCGTLDGSAAVLTSPQRQNPTFAFSASSFKGLKSLLLDEVAGAASPGHGKMPVFHRPRPAASALHPWRPVLPTAPGDKRVVLYFTSLSVVRRTFEDCRAVRSILRGLRVAVDERDLSMDKGFLDELRGILGRRRLPLPRVFIAGRYVGGADEIRQLIETGELKRYVEGVPPAEPGVCGVCGGFRFVLCEGCSGSRKCHNEKGGFRSCALCNENGLARCRVCCCPDLI
ncbi:hypothetical protein Taro_053364 [Colocasia esculenta]|uniref:Glutaredoxin domain-containing protein n=1 Tax=Colocasia esculenta TaxID=4460 RepID=A0A843XMD2_COLES|nr:hypothetical protein [Colocasia esculenta]